MDIPHEDEGIPNAPEEDGDASPGATCDEPVACGQPKADEHAPAYEDKPLEGEASAGEGTKKKARRPRREVKKLSKEEARRQMILHLIALAVFWMLWGALYIYDKLQNPPDIDIPPPPKALAIESELQSLAKQGTRWPGFDPLKYPLVVYDTEDTYLFRHPKPPKEFMLFKHRKDTYVFDGRYKGIWDCYETKFSGKYTAIVSVKPGLGNAEYYSDTALHELFHVYQDECEELWPSSSSWESVFMYPRYDYKLYKTLRLEELALANALEANSADEGKGWARRAIILADKAYEMMPADCADMIRSRQMVEGLATYVDRQFHPRKNLADYLRRGFKPEEYYDRVYLTGDALALLLEDFNPKWKQTFNNKSVTWLEDMLRQGLGKGGYSCAFSQEELEQADKEARGEMTEAIHRRISLNRSFDKTEGGMLIVEAGKESLYLVDGHTSGIKSVLGGKFVSQRGIKIGNNCCTLEIGQYPVLLDLCLLKGNNAQTRRLVIRGLDNLELSSENDKLTVKCDRLNGEFSHAAYTFKDNKLTIMLHDDKPKKRG